MANTTSRDTRRRFEQWAHNPACEANTLSAVHGIPMATVAVADGVKPTGGQSPFAIARGQTFERALFRNDAASLRAELERVAVLPKKSSGFLDLRMRRHGGRMANLDMAREETLGFLERLAQGKLRPRPTIIASPTLLIPSGVMLPEALLVIDVIAVRYEARPTLIVGEIKTYPDRGGYTDTEELALARAQAGVYVHALRMVVAERGLTDKIDVADRGFLVLSRPGYNKPSVRANEDLRFQAKRAARGFEMLEAAAAKLPPVVQDENARVQAVLGAQTAYDQRCVQFCDRAEACRNRALLTANPALLGDDVVRLLGTMTLARATELQNGARPRDDAERQVLTVLRRHG